MIDWVTVALAFFLGATVGTYVVALVAARDERGFWQSSAIDEPYYRCQPTTAHKTAMAMFQTGELSGVELADILVGEASPELIKRVREWRS